MFEYDKCCISFLLYIFFNYIFTIMRGIVDKKKIVWHIISILFWIKLLPLPFHKFRHAPRITRILHIILKPKKLLCHSYFSVVSIHLAVKYFVFTISLRNQLIYVILTEFMKRLPKVLYIFSRCTVIWLNSNFGNLRNQRNVFH